jgi:hypothetical protein
VSNTDKHKPLSAEELFKLLDNTSNKASDFDELDDFEKEALEGFSAHSDAQKAKALTDDLNFAISKKATESNKSGTKNKVIWFSAAASIVLIFMVSIFFLNQSKEDSTTNIALNELNKDETVAAPLLEESKPLETTIENVALVADENKNATQNQLKLQETIVSRKIASESLAGAASGGETKVNTIDILAKDESKARSERDDRDQEKLSEELADKVGAKKKEKNSLEQEQTNSDLQVKQNAVTFSSSELAENTNGTKEEDSYYKADSDRLAVAKKSVEKEKSAKPVSTSYDNSNAVTETASGKTAAVPSSAVVGGNSSSNAYYLGSELAVRDYVLEFLAKKSGSVIITGKYKITGNVSAKGELNVVTINQISSENCYCIEQIKEALNAMIKWNPALEDGKKVSSKVDFILSF